MTSPSPDPFSLLAIPPFEPAPWCANGHLQTLAGAYWGAAPRLPTESRRHWIVLDDGDWLALGRAVLAVAGADRLVGLVTTDLAQTAELLAKLSAHHAEIQYLLSRPDGSGVLVLNPVTAPDWRAAVPGHDRVEPLFSVSVIGRSIGFENAMFNEALRLAADCAAEVFCVEANPLYLTFYCRGETGAALTAAFHRAFVTPR